VAGATDLGVEMNLRGRRFEHLVSVEALPELREFALGTDEVVIGAGVPLGEIGRLWHDAPAVIREWLRLFASPLIRNRATLGGNLATASPIGDGAPLLMALDASVRIASLQGDRLVQLSDFFTAYRQTRLLAGEVLVAIHIPRRPATIARFFKVAKRRMDDISTVAAAFAIELDSAGFVLSARLAFGGVAATPVRAFDAEHELIGSRWNPAAVARAKAAIRESLRPISDHRGSAEFRLAMAQSLLDKFWHEQQRKESAA